MIEYTLVRSSRKTLSVQVTGEGEVVVRAPRLYPRYKIEAFLRQKESWIRERQQRTAAAAHAPSLSEEEHKRLVKEAKAWFAERTARFAPLLGVTYGSVTIRTQKTRWGSCTGKGDLNFNCLLMLAPEEIRDYVVIHELCHRRYMDHSAAFWAEVERVLPDYEIRRKWLKDNGAALMAAAPK